MRAQYLAEQRDGTRMCHQRRGFVEACPFRRGKSVVAARIEIKLDVWAALEGGLDLVARFGRRVFVELGEMEDHRSPDAAGLGNIGLDADAVIADRAIDVGTRADEVGELAAEAEAE